MNQEDFDAWKKHCDESDSAWTKDISDINCQLSTEGFLPICDHTYPDGKSAIENMSCTICKSGASN